MRHTEQAHATHGAADDRRRTRRPTGPTSWAWLLLVGLLILIGSGRPAIAETATLQVFHEGRSLRSGDRVDLRTYLPGETGTDRFFIGNKSTDELVLPAGSFTVEGEAFRILSGELRIPPGGSEPLEIEVTAGAVGTHTGRLVLEADGPAPGAPGFEIELWISTLDDSSMADLVDEAYARYAAYTASSGTVLTATPGAFEAETRARFDRHPAVSFITQPGGRSIRAGLSFLGGSAEGDRWIVEPAWHDAPSLVGGKVWERMEGKSLAELFAENASSRFRRRTSRVMRYTVSLSLGGESLAYQAAVFWGGGARLGLIDHKLDQLMAVQLLDAPPGQGATLLADFQRDLALGRDEVIGEGESTTRECLPTTEHDQRLWRALTGVDHVPGLPQGHGVLGSIVVEYTCGSACLSGCEPFLNHLACAETGQGDEFFHQTAGVGDTASYAPFPSREVCGAVYNCVTVYCPDTYCPLEVSAEARGFGPPHPGFFFSTDHQTDFPSDPIVQEYRGGGPPHDELCRQIWPVELDVVNLSDPSAPFPPGTQVEVSFSTPRRTHRLPANGPGFWPNVWEVVDGDGYTTSLDVTSNPAGNHCLSCQIAEGASGVGEGPVTVRVECTTGEAAGACGQAAFAVSVDMSIEDRSYPDEHLLEGSVTVNLAVGQERQSLIFSESGQGNFPQLLENGDEFVVTVDHPDSWVCAVVPAAGQISGAHVELQGTCSQVILGDPRDDCPDFITGCIASPDCNDRLVFVYSTHVSSYGQFGEPLGEEETAFFAVVRTCDTASPDPAGGVGGQGNTIQTSGPVLYLRTRVHPTPSTPVSGVIEISGVARDDRYGVTEIHTLLDGQPITLQAFGTHRFDASTCSEYDSGLACDWNSGFAGLLDTSTLSAGPHRLTLVAVNSAGVPNFQRLDFVVDEQLPAPEPLRIVEEPADRVVASGDALSLHFGVTGGRPPRSYQWQGSPLPNGPWVDLDDETLADVTGARTSTVRRDPIPRNADGYYRCRAWDADGTEVTSRRVRVVVTP